MVEDDGDGAMVSASAGAAPAMARSTTHLVTDRPASSLTGPAFVVPGDRRSCSGRLPGQSSRRLSMRPPVHRVSPVGQRLERHGAKQPLIWTTVMRAAGRRHSAATCAFSDRRRR
jgi:hypothetical protein